MAPLLEESLCAGQICTGKSNSETSLSTPKGRRLKTQPQAACLFFYAFSPKKIPT